ncbi:hypothetical protein GUITHDRAFT_103610 [Guillardia theta CCMP2712]|uniref:Uncharacterized protein n=1 Tax=Guillardia theta (strain CCMP2712) TaxID=905079 RepID=L1JSG5_GUITC|nr:hypothetical protein GUITHDRAFT_103610 [Guillardia theta CCMP2712]EKX51023.1 hypothetical protein GUITHDRAFT_103610 [Guillardia theta CCMP2712]|eukprot:XP_005838003.1 hypothetical protein GUITHDRAFT_103610 [Guillardia theta CCMP2712]
MLASAPFETPGSWDDNVTYNFTTDPAYGDSSYPMGFNELWSPTWQHLDNLDHIRPSMGMQNWDNVSAWNLPGRSFPGPGLDNSL